MAHRNDIVDFCNTALAVADYADYSKNGLQVEGPPEVKRIGLAVDACMNVYKKAIVEKCQLLITHHGLIWGGIESVRGFYYQHLNYLIRNNLNLYAAHLPLDLHPTIGNNSELMRIVDCKEITRFGLYKGIPIGYRGVLAQSHSLENLSAKLQAALGGQSTMLAFGKKEIRSIAVVSGGGSDALPEAIDKGIDCFITGESQHQDYHRALEAEINVIYLGHYHSEKPGVQALGKLIEKQFGTSTVFLDEPTLV